MSELGGAITTVVVVYVGLMFGISWWVRDKVDDVEDFLVAGRRLPFLLAGPTLLATWFGAGTLLIAADEIRAEGLPAAALEPLGTGVCLVVAGLFFAGPLWRMNLLTLPDLFRRKFGPRTEFWGSVFMVPGYFGWVAAQFVALAGLLNLFMGVPVWAGILLSALVGMGYTLVGGMWSVTLTDAVQMALIFVGLLILGYQAFGVLGGGSLSAGFGSLAEATPPDRWRYVPTDDLASVVGWLGVFAVGVFGNLPGQDLTQRIFAARSANVAKWACIAAGAVYVTLGMLPGYLGLAVNALLPDAAAENSVLLLAQELLSPALVVIFVVAILSAVLSTIDSAILSPSSVIAQNILSRRLSGDVDLLRLNRSSIVFVTACSLVVAYLGESAFSLLEAAYEVGLVALVLPLVVGVYGRPRSEGPMLWGMGLPTALWAGHFVPFALAKVGFISEAAAAPWEHFMGPLAAALLPFELPTALTCAALGFVVYAIAEAQQSRRPGTAEAN